MTNTVTEIRLDDRTRKSATELPGEEVREQLERVLESPVFQRSERLSRFLRYLVERRLQGDSRIREVDVALDVFDRRGSFDSRIDPIVRVEARRLRKAMAAYYVADGAKDPVLIGIPSRGYTPAFSRRQATRPVPVPASRHCDGPIRTEATGPSIAVLPFINMTNEAEREVFCQGVTEELINSLTRIDDFKVVSRTAVYQFKDVAIDLRKVGQELGVQVIVEGSVRADGERLRVTAQLSSAADGFHLWSQTFDASLTDMFTVQENLAQEISVGIAEQLVAA